MVMTPPKENPDAHDGSNNVNRSLNHSRPVASSDGGHEPGSLARISRGIATAHTDPGSSNERSITASLFLVSLREDTTSCVGPTTTIGGCTTVSPLVEFWDNPRTSQNLSSEEALLQILDRALSIIEDDKNDHDCVSFTTSSGPSAVDAVQRQPSPRQTEFQARGTMTTDAVSGEEDVYSGSDLAE